MALNRKQTIWLAGGAAALLLAVLIGWAIKASQKDDGPRMNTEGPGLVLDIDDAPVLDNKRTLRCFVSGEFVGMLTIADCATKNGVAANALDVGVDESGEMTAAPTASLAPPPPVQQAEPETITPAEEGITEPVLATGPVGACLRYAGNEWTRLSDAISLNACATLLYDGRCVSPGQAQYGRWGSQTLRLVPKRVEISDDNRTFRTLVEQGQGCSVK